MKTIDERITELRRFNYDPLRPDNLAETLANLTNEQVKTMSDALKLKKPQYSLVGAYIAQCSLTHWHRLARIQAESDEENEHLAACQRCYGEGCSSCNDLDDNRREGNE